MEIRPAESSKGCLRNRIALSGALVLAWFAGTGCGHGPTPPPPAIAGFSAQPGTITAGTDAALTATFSGGAGVISPGALPAVSGIPVRVTPAATTTYTLTVTGSDGAQATQGTLVTVVAQPILPVITAPGHVAPGATGLVASVPAQDGCTYQWTIAQGAITAGASTPQITFTAGAAGAVQLFCSVSNAAGTAVQGTAQCAIDPAPTILSFMAASPTLTAGNSTTLTALFSGGTGTVDQGIGPITSGVPVYTGHLTAGTTFTLTVTDPAGQSTTAQAAILVVAPPAIQSFSVAQSPVTAGTGTTLTAAFTGGTGSVSGGVGTVTSGIPAGTGNLAASAVYTLTVTNAAGSSVTAQAPISVVAAPAIQSFSAAQSPVTAGTGTTLTAAFTGGTGSVSGGVGAVTSGIPAGTGNLAASAVYTLTVTNAAGSSVTAQAPISVVAAPAIQSFSAAQSPVTAGTGTTLTAAFTGGTGSVSGGVGAVTSGIPAGTGNLASSAVYTLTVTNAAGTSVTAQAPVNVVAAPAIQSFTALQSPVTAGTGTTLTAAFTGGTGSVSGGVGPVTSGIPASTGNLASSAVYTLTVTNAAGTSVAAQAPVNVVVAPAIQSFTALQSPVTAGTGTTLTAAFTGGTGSVSGGVGPVTSGIPAATGSLAASAVYTLTVTNAAGTAVTAQAPVSVVAAPAIQSFTALQNPVTAGTGTTLTAAFTGGTGSVSGGVGPVTSGIPAATGSMAASAVYTLTVTNAAGTSVTAQAPVSVVAAPAITAFTASPQVITLGQGGVLSYAFTGGTGSIDQGIGPVASGGTSNVSPSANQNYTLTVTNPAGTSVSQGVSLAVVPAPNLTSFTVTPNVMATGGGTVMITAVFSGGVATVAQGPGPAGIGPLVSGQPVASGVLDASTIFTLTLGNAAGTRLSASTGVLVGPLSVLAGVLSGQGAADGTGTAARFDFPLDVAVDAGGNVLVADFSNNLIREVAPGGVVTSFTRCVRPYGMAMAPSGNIYVASPALNQILMIAPDGTSSVVAGSGQAGCADGTGTAATFSEPSGVALDSAGNLYVADSNNATIRMIAMPGAVVTTLAGTANQWGTTNGTGTQARFIVPVAVALDGQGNVYVGDLGSGLRKIAMPGAVVSTVAFIDQCAGLAVDALGNVYASSSDDATIVQVTPAGAVNPVAGSFGVQGWADGQGSAALFNEPRGLALDAAGNLYVADAGNNVVRMIALPSGTVTTLAGLATQTGTSDGTGSAALFDDCLTGVVVDPSGNLYLTDSLTGNFRMITAQGVVTTQGGGGLAASIVGVARDGSGNFFMADGLYPVIWMIGPGAGSGLLAGNPNQSGYQDGPGASATFNHPRALAVDASGNVYVGDFSNGTVRKITMPDGTVSTLAGTPGQFGKSDGFGPAASFESINGLAVDEEGNVYVSDGGNATIRKITPAGAVTTLAGTAGATGTADGTGPAAQFLSPMGIAYDGMGNLYVADEYNNAIRRVTTQGVVTTVVGTAGNSSGNFPGPLPATLFNPKFVAVDPISGALYIVLDAAVLKTGPVTP